MEEYNSMVQSSVPSKTCHILKNGVALCGAGMPNDWLSDVWCDDVFWTLHVGDRCVMSTIRYGDIPMCQSCVDTLTAPPP